MATGDLPDVGEISCGRSRPLRAVAALRFWNTICQRSESINRTGLADGPSPLRLNAFSEASPCLLHPTSSGPTPPGPELNTDERNEVKKVAKKLLAKLKSITTLDWQKTAQARAKVLDAIESALDEGLPRAYTPEVFKAKAGIVFRHVYERYGRAA